VIKQRWVTGLAVMAALAIVLAVASTFFTAALQMRMNDFYLSDVEAGPTEAQNLQLIQDSAISGAVGQVFGPLVFCAVVAAVSALALAAYRAGLATHAQLGKE
jgi:hypothetical protein